MTSTAAQQHSESGLPADPAGLRLTVTSECWPGGPGGRGPEECSLLVRHEQLQAGQHPSRIALGTRLDSVGRVGMLRVPLRRGVISPNDFDYLSGRAGESALEQEVRTAAAEQLFTRRDGQRRLVPEVRSSLERGPRTDLGDLLLLDDLSVSEEWAVQDFDLLLLGEAVARSAAEGLCFLAAVPSLMRSSPNRALGVLRRAGFRPAVGPVMVSASSVPRLAGRGEQVRNWGFRTLP
ncbi:hypothetical protein [Kitasatospora griseola]|uniref:hypothetical protein n=1 Tax=Kitasatospora griseola TaxID=2064 RepID=UPI00343D529B